MPALDNVRNPLPLRIAHLRQRRQRIGICLNPRKHKVAIDRQRCRIRHRIRINLMHFAQRTQARCPKRILLRIAAKQRDLPQGVFRQAMRLLIVAHLQPMLDHAQPLIRHRQRIAHLRRAQLILGQHRERGQRALHPQLGNPPTPDQLLRLHEKLDLTNPAHASFDIMARKLNHLAAFHIHLPLDRMNIRNRREIERLAPDKRHQLAHIRGRRFRIPRNRPRLDHRRAFPVLADGLIIRKRRRDGDRQRRRHRIRPQPQIGAKHIPIRRPLLHQRDEITRQLGHELLRIARAGVGQAVLIEQHNQIDIARII